MKILHLIDSDGLYGAERVLLQLAAEFTRRGHEVWVGTIVAPTDRSNELADAACALGIRTIQFPMSDGFNLGGLASIRSFLRREMIEIIHGHGYKANIFVSVLRRWVPAVRALVTLHGWAGVHRFSKLALMEALERHLLRGVDRVIAVSPVIAARMAPLVSADRLQLVWNALPVGNGSTVLTVDQSIVSFCNSGRTIMAIGRLSPEKGFDLLLRALAQARVSIPDLKLVIFGEGPQRQALTELICALQLESSVALAGYHDHASHYLQYGSLFVMSSLTEGLPLVLLEAMASRIPIIATDVGAVRATLRDGACGALVRAGDVPALAHAIKAAMSQREVNTRTLDAAQHAIEENHSLGRMADAYQSCYLSMLRPPSLGGRELMDSSSS